jgi:hypothetical protein
VETLEDAPRSSDETAATAPSSAFHEALIIKEARRRQRRRWLGTGIAVLVAAAIALVFLLPESRSLSGPNLRGDSSSPKSPPAVTGVLTGTADACSGLPGHVPADANLRVYRGDAATARKDVYRPVDPVAKKQVPNNSTYRFALPSGRYFITNSSTQFAHPFVLVAGSTIHLDVPNGCE